MEKLRLLSARSLLLLPAVALLASGFAEAQTLSADKTSLSFFYTIGRNSPAPQNIQIAGSAALVTNVTSDPANNSNKWLLVVTPSNPVTTPYTLQVFVLPQTSAAGVYNGTITVTSPGATNSPLTIPVTLTVSANPLIIPNPTSMLFTYSSGAAQPPAQTIGLTSSLGTPFDFSVGIQMPGGGTWLTATPLSGNAPGTAISVGVVTTGLPVGTYTGNVVVNYTGAGNSPFVIPVTLRILNEIRLTLNPSALQFDFQIGGPNPQDRFVSASSTGVPVNFTAAAAVTTPAAGTWLIVNPASGLTPQTLTVSANPAGLPAGTYSGTVTVTAGSATNSPQTIPVTLRVTTDPLLTASPSQLTFTHQFGGTAPPRQVIVVSNPGNGISATVTASGAGGSWLNAVPGTSLSPLAISVGVSPGSLVPGVYAGNVTITGTAANSPFNIPVTLIVTSTPALRLNQSQLNFVFQTGGSSPSPATISVGSSSTAIAFTPSASASGGLTWLRVTAPSSNTPVDASVTVDPSALTPGVYTGTVSFTTTDQGATPISIPVRLTVSANPLLVAPQGPLTFSFNASGTPPNNQTFNVGSTGAAFNFDVGTTTSSGGNWLVRSPLSGTTGSSVVVGANTLGLPEGTYTGLVSISAPSVANSPQYIPVVFTVSTTSQLVIAPATPIVFTQAIGSTTPPAQTISVSSQGGSILNFTTTVRTLSGGSWLAVSPPTGLTPTQLQVTVNPANLDPGSYSGTISIESAQAANSPVILPVTFTIARPLPNLLVSRETVPFTATAGGAAPAGQQVTLTSSGDPIAYSVAFSTATGGPWLAVQSSALTTPATLTVTANPAGLVAGTYTGTVTVSSTGAANAPRAIAVSITITGVQTPAPVVTRIVNSATFIDTSAVPGMIVTLGGTNVGPATPAGLKVTAGVVDNLIGGTRVLFDGIPSPMVSASVTQTSAVVPYEIAGRLAATVQVEVDGVRSNSIQLQVRDSSPGLFTLNQNGSGPGAILNQDNTGNTPNNPAARGTFVVLYATGEGQTDRPANGVVPGVGGVPLKKPLLPVRVRIAGVESEVAYAGSAPGFVAGVMQVNVKVPDNILAGNASIELIVGGTSSPSGVTVSVR